MTPRIATPSVSGGIFRSRVAFLAAACGGVVAAAEGPAPAHRQRIVDPAVVTAGVPACAAGSCHAGCRHGHHAGCRDGICAPSCPVRPQQFGFYGTQWRKWPGREVMPVSGERALAPSLPPRSAVPDADAESLAPPAGGGPEAEPTPPNAADVREPTPVRPAPAPVPPPAREPEPRIDRPDPELPPERQPEPERRREPVERAPLPAVEAEPQPQPEPSPEPEPSPPPARIEPPRPEDENLFDEVSGSGWRARRRFAVGVAASPAEAAPVDAVRPAMHDAPAKPRGIPRVPFDPAAETRRLRAIR